MRSFSVYLRVGTAQSRQWSWNSEFKERFYDPQDGVVLINGEDLRSLGMSAVRMVSGSPERNIVARTTCGGWAIKLQRLRNLIGSECSYVHVYLVQ